MILYLRLLFGATSFISDLYLVHFSASLPGGTLASSFMEREPQSSASRLSENRASLRMRNVVGADQPEEDRQRHRKVADRDHHSNEDADALEHGVVALVVDSQRLEH